MSLRARVLRNLTAGAFGRLVNAFGPLLLVPTYLTAWGNLQYGEWLLITSVPACIMLAPDFGIALAVANRMAILAGEGRQQDAQLLYRSSFWALLTMSATFACVASVVAFFFDWTTLFHLQQIDRSTAGAIVSILCLQLVAHQLLNCVTGVYRCSLASSRSTFMISALTLMEFGLAISLLYLGATPLMFAGFQLCWKAFSLALLLVDSSRLPNAPRLGFRGARFSLVSPLLLPALGCGGMPLLQALQNQGLPALIGMVLGPQSVPVFQTLRVMTNAFRTVFHVVSVAVLTELPHALGSGENASVGRLLRRVRSFGVLIAAIALIGVLLTGNWVYTTWTAGKLQYNYDLCLLLTLSHIPYFLGTPANIYLFAANKAHLILPMTLLWMFLSLGVFVLLAPFCGVLAAGYATLLWEILQAMTFIRCFRNTAPEIWAWYSARDGRPTDVTDAQLSPVHGPQ